MTVSSIQNLEGVRSSDFYTFIYIMDYYCDGLLDLLSLRGN